MNNRNIAFDYNALYGNVASTIPLAAGRNTLIIKGSNEAGSNSDDVAIIYNRPVSIALPVVKFIDPAGPVTVEKNVYAISVQTRNVKQWQDVTVSVNGDNFTNFNFSPDGIVKTNVPLREGINRVQVTGKNESGSASDIATITYTVPVKAVPPVISILTPGNSPFNTFEPLQEIRARITGISGRENILLSVNGTNISGFNFDNNSLILSTSVTLREGTNTITITARNAAGQDVKSQVIIKETRPCPAPVLRMIAPAQNEMVTDKPAITIRTSVSNIPVREQLSVSLNNRPITNYNFNGNEIAFTASLVSGINTYTISAENSCGTQKITCTIFYKPVEVVVVDQPCLKPATDFLVSAVADVNATHVLKGSATNVKNKSDITVTINDSPFEAFSFNPATGEISANFKFNPGSYAVKVTVKNECGSDTYSGPASSLYFMPIAGGGDAVVKGTPFTIRPGQYYLFTGNLTVTVSTKNPGSMGQWSVCIVADKEPQSGNGNNRPKSPCEEQDDDVKGKKSGEGKDQ